MARTRLQELDALRGLAAVAVMLHHNLLAASLLPSDNVFVGTPLAMIGTGRHAVMFFFVLSGFVLTRSLPADMTLRRWIAYAMQRSVRLVLPVFASVIASVVLYRIFYAGTWPGESEWLRDYLWQAPPSATSFFQQALLLRSAYRNEANNVLWSLAHEWRISVLIPALACFAMLREQRGGLVVLLGAATIAAAAVGPWERNTIALDGGFVGQLRSNAYFVLPFAVGAALERFRVVEFRLRGYEIVLVLSAAAMLARMETDMTDYLMSGLLIWAAVQSRVLKSLLSIRPMQWLGRVSFSLYLVHELVIAPLYHRFHGASPLLLLIVSCVLSLPVAALFWHLVERPSHRLAKRVWTRVGAAT